MNENKLTVIGSKSYQQCEVVMLPTEKASNLFLGSKTNKIYIEPIGDIGIPQHLYILSSEEIKEGEDLIKGAWYVNTFREFGKPFQNDNLSNNGYLKKVIATTNESLDINIWQGNKSFIPRPSDDFIKAFVEKQGKINKVLVEYENHFTLGNYMNTCIVCQKQFSNTDKHWKYCQEHSIKLKVAPDNTITIRAIQEVYVSKKVLPFVIEALGFDPTKEKEKTSWNREEVVEILKKFDIEMGDTHGPTTRNKWIEENL